MAEIPLSLAEKTFILHGVDAGFRSDGRRSCEYRPMELETKLMPQSHGSARFRIGNTDVLVGVKVEVDTPILERPDEGRLEFSVDCSANAAPEFEGKGGEEMAMEISNILTTAYQSSNAIDLRKLCILSGQRCWKIYVDILILQCSGNVFDVVGVAVKAALCTTEIPKVIECSLDGGEPDIKLSDDPYDSERLDSADFPLLITLCKIGDYCVVDPTAEEETCSSASVVMAITPNGRITSIVKTGYGSLQMATLMKSLEMGRNIGMELQTVFNDTLRKEEAIGDKRPIVGFLR